MSRENKEPLIQSFSSFFSALLQGNIVGSLHLPQLAAVTKKVVLTKKNTHLWQSLQQSTTYFHYHWTNGFGVHRMEQESLTELEAVE